ncbi:MAG: hypothetical protein WBP81_02135 [Solirubrobacteraceae bacterium]
MTLLLPGSRVLHLLDGALALWVAAWIALGVAIGVNVSHLTALSETVAKDGQAVETVAGSLHSLGSVPLIGGQISKDAEQVRQAGARAAVSGQRSVSSIRVLSVLLAIAVAFFSSVSGQAGDRGARLPPPAPGVRGAVGRCGGRALRCAGRRGAATAGP